MAIDKIGTNGLVAADIVPPDGSISTAKIANDAVNAAKIAAGAVGTDEIADGTVTSAEIANDAVINDKILTGTMSPQKLEYRDYFRFRITTAKTGLTDNTEYVTPFNTNGTVDFDSTSGFSNDANNTWTPALSTFSETQFWLFGISAGFDTNNNEALRDAVVGVQQSTDGGSTWYDLFHNATRTYDTTGDDSEGTTLTATYLHNINPTANHRYRMMVFANTDQAHTSTWDLNAAGSGIIGGTTSIDDNSITYWWGLRVY